MMMIWIFPHKDEQWWCYRFSSQGGIMMIWTLLGKGEQVDGLDPPWIGGVMMMLSLWIRWQWCSSIENNQWARSCWWGPTFTCGKKYPLLRMVLWTRTLCSWEWSYPLLTKDGLTDDTLLWRVILHSLVGWCCRQEHSSMESGPNANRIRMVYDESCINLWMMCSCIHLQMISTFICRWCGPALICRQDLHSFVDDMVLHSFADDPTGR